MRYFWKTLCIVSGSLLVLAAGATMAIVRVHILFCRKANPYCSPIEMALIQMSTIPGCPGRSCDLSRPNFLAESMEDVLVKHSGIHASGCCRVPEFSCAIPASWRDEGPAGPVAVPILPSLPTALSPRQS